eukprot:Sspe_Gene.22195::Locus_8396_Transcript_2_4_Confidence_0.444_Length_643::g.22195::m.22195
MPNQGKSLKDQAKEKVGKKAREVEEEMAEERKVPETEERREEVAEAARKVQEEAQGKDKVQEKARDVENKAVLHKKSRAGRRRQTRQRTRPEVKLKRQQGRCVRRWGCGSVQRESGKWRTSGTRWSRLVSGCRRSRRLWTSWGARSIPSLSPLHSPPSLEAREVQETPCLSILI